MSTPELRQQPTGNGPPGTKSNTWIIVLIVAAVLAVPAICVCGAVGVAFLRWLSPGRNIEHEQQRPLIKAPQSADVPSFPPPSPPPDLGLREPLLNSPAEPEKPRPVVDDSQPVIEQPDPAVEEPEDETGVPAVQNNVLFTLEPFTSDKAGMPRNTRAFLVSNEEGKPTTYVVTLLQFYPDRDPRLHKEDKLIAYATGFTMDAKVPWPATGVVSFRFLDVGGPETTISVSVDKKPVWTYQGGPQESLTSPPVALASEQGETKTFDMSLTVGGGARNPTGGIQLFSVIASEEDALEQTDVPPISTAEREAAGDRND